MKRKSLGENDEVIIVTLIKLGNEATGAEIRRQIVESTSRRPTVGAFYSAIDGLLEKKFLCVKRYEEGTPETGYKQQRILEVTSNGRQAVLDLVLERQALKRGYELLLGERQVVGGKGLVF